MPALVALVEWAALRAPLDQMPRPSSAALVGLAAMPGLPVLVRREPVALAEHLRRGTPWLAAQVVPVALAPMAALAAPAAVALAGRAAAVVLVRRAQAALVAVVARAVLASMRVH